MKRSFVCHGILFVLIAVILLMTIRHFFPHHHFPSIVLFGGIAYASAFITVIVSCAFSVFIMKE